MTSVRRMTVTPVSRASATHSSASCAPWAEAMTSLRPWSKRSGPSGAGWSGPVWAEFSVIGAAEASGVGVAVIGPIVTVRTRPWRELCRFPAMRVASRREPQRIRVRPAQPAQAAQADPWPEAHVPGNPGSTEDAPLRDRRRPPAARNRDEPRQTATTRDQPRPTAANKRSPTRGRASGCSRDWTRTNNRPINSRMLCH